MARGQTSDSLILFAPWLVPWTLWLLALSSSQGLALAFIFFGILDSSHRVATIPLSFLDREATSGAHTFFFWGAAVLGSLGIAQSQFPDTVFAQVWISLFLYWGAFHIIRQHFGFLRLYQNRDKTAEIGSLKWEGLALYSGCCFPYFLNMSRQWIFQNEGSIYYRFWVPEYIAWCCLGVFLISMSIALTRGLKNGIRKIPLSVFHLILVVSNFSAGILWVGRTHILLAALFITCYHNVQYYPIVWQVGQRRYESDHTPAFPYIRSLFRSKGLFVIILGSGRPHRRNSSRQFSGLYPSQTRTGPLA